MAEDIGDLLQTGSAQSHLRRGRSSQGMGTQGAATQAATNERLLDGIAHNCGGDRDVMRRAVEAHIPDSLMHMLFGRLGMLLYCRARRT